MTVIVTIMIVVIVRDKHPDSQPVWGSFIDFDYSL